MTTDQKAIEAARECAAAVWRNFIQTGATIHDEVIIKSLSLHQLFAIVEAATAQPHAIRCNLQKPSPFSDKAREEHYKLKCNCWKSVIDAYHTAQKENRDRITAQHPE